MGRYDLQLATLKNLTGCDNNPTSYQILKDSECCKFFLILTRVMDWQFKCLFSFLEFPLGN